MRKKKSNLKGKIVPHCNIFTKLVVGRAHKKSMIHLNRALQVENDGPVNLARGDTAAADDGHRQPARSKRYVI